MHSKSTPSEQVRRLSRATTVRDKSLEIQGEVRGFLSRRLTLMPHIGPKTVVLHQPQQHEDKLSGSRRQCTTIVRAGEKRSRRRQIWWKKGAQTERHDIFTTPISIVRLLISESCHSFLATYHHAVLVPQASTICAALDFAYQASLPLRPIGHSPTSNQQAVA
jgi:hypothetical protein